MQIMLNYRDFRFKCALLWPSGGGCKRLWLGSKTAGSVLWIVTLRVQMTFEDLI